MTQTTPSHSQAVEAAEVRIEELLLSVPTDARMIYEHSPTHSRNIPVGMLCKAALAEIYALRAALTSQQEVAAPVGEEEFFEELNLAKLWCRGVAHTADTDKLLNAAKAVERAIQILAASRDQVNLAASAPPSSKTQDEFAGAESGGSIK